MQESKSKLPDHLAREELRKNYRRRSTMLQRIRFEGSEINARKPVIVRAEKTNQFVQKIARLEMIASFRVPNA